MSEESFITDELRAAVGKEGEPLTIEVDRTAVRMFARAVGHTDLVFYDEEYARSKGHRSIICPPGFLGHAIHTPQNPSEIVGSSIRRTPALPGLEIRNILNGGTEFEYYGEDICAGDVLKSVTKVVGLQERKGSLGLMLFLTTETNLYNQQGKLVATERDTAIIY
ncbi:MAG: MaoC family dehydratase N-terminal domain-containing protein [Dehalococcoidia bacterium]|nr:MaoC family dehydratase N-terminal domain-containing protein [Dehalococcoidia bacterium]